MPAGRFVKRQIVIIILINLEKPFIPFNSFFLYKEKDIQTSK